MLRYQALGNYFFMGNDLEELARAYWRHPCGEPPEPPRLSFEDWMRERAAWSRRWDGSAIRADTALHFMEDLEARDHVRRIPEGHIVVRTPDGKLFVAGDFPELARQLWESRFIPEPTIEDWMARNQELFKASDGTLTVVLRTDTVSNHMEDLIANGWCERLPDA